MSSTVDGWAMRERTWAHLVRAMSARAAASAGWRTAVEPVAECEVDYRAGRGEHQERHNGQRVRGERVQHLPVRPEELLYTQDCEYVYGRGEATM